MRKYFIPKARGDKSLWMGNYNDKIATHGATVGLTAGEITGQQTAATNIKNAIAATDLLRAQYNAQVQNERSITETNLKTITDSITRQKTHADYTVSIGDDLGVIGEEHTIDVNNAKPQLKISQTAEGWLLTFSLHNFFDGVKIERKRPGGEWTYLTIDTGSPYLDSDPQENGTQYRAVYILDDHPVGQWSDVLPVQL